MNDSPGLGWPEDHLPEPGTPRPRPVVAAPVVPGVPAWFVLGVSAYALARAGRGIDRLSVASYVAPLVDGVDPNRPRPTIEQCGRWLASMYGAGLLDREGERRGVWYWHPAVAPTIRRIGGSDTDDARRSARGLAVPGVGPRRPAKIMRRGEQ